MSYTVMGWAEYILYRAHQNKVCISNTKLQFILFFLLREFYQATNSVLFNAILTISSFPIFQEAYDQYQYFAGAPLYLFGTSLSHEALPLIDVIIDKYTRKKLFELAAESQATLGRPKQGTEFSALDCCQARVL